MPLQTACLDNLSYEEGTHQYRYAGREVPGITRLLGELGYNKGSRFYTEESRQLGTAVHNMLFHIERLCPRTTELEEVLECFHELPELLHSYARQYLLWKQESGFIAAYLEEKVFSVSMRVAGRLDLVGFFPGDEWAVVDYKTWKSQGPIPKRGSELQTAFYAIGAEESMGITVTKRVVLQLSGGTGTYRAFPCRNTTDYQAVRAAASVWWDLKNHGYLDPAESPREED